MKELMSFFRLLCLVSIFVSFQKVQAGDLEWSGKYTFEANHLENPELNSATKSVKDYGLSHLILSPKIVASDGLIINARFDIFNNSAYPNSQMGQIWGQGVNAGANTSTDTSNSYSENQADETLKVSNLYLTYIQEFGALTVGRAPVHFGLGMTHNAGLGDFDHFYDVRDIVAYKMVFGNAYVMPSIAKMNEGTANQNSDDVNEYNVEISYSNPEKLMEMAIMYQMRRANSLAAVFPGATLDDSLNLNLLNVFFKKQKGDFDFAVEGSFISGGTGDLARDHSGLGLAFELNYKPADSKWSYGGDFGMASGDDTSTANYEGFGFDRNYDVALLLFNHVLGSADILNSSLYRANSAQVGSGTALDEEVLTNTTYLAPYVNYKWKDKWNLGAKFIYAQLNETASGQSSDLGYEFDFSVEYKPKKGVRWVNNLAYLIPGSAFENGTSLSTDSTLALFSRVAISF